MRNGCFTSVFGLRPKQLSSYYSSTNLAVKVLSPVDFIHAKLRRFTEEDIEDAIFVANKFHVMPEEIKKAAEKAINKSPKDTSIFFFKNNLKTFIHQLKD